MRAAAALLVALMAGGGAMAADEPAAPALAGTTWRAETITGRPVIDSAASTITFEADGRVSGRAGCNRYFGTSTIAGEQLSFGAMGATQMACAPALMDQETRFFQALGERRALDDRSEWPAADLFRRRRSAEPLRAVRGVAQDREAVRGSRAA